MEDQEKNYIDVSLTGNTVNNQRITSSMVRSVPASSINHLIFENLMHGRLARLQRLKSDTREES